MAGSSGNGKADTLREKFARNQAAREQALERLEGIEWEDEEITAEHILEAVKVGAAAATGKHTAMSKDQADEITLTDHGQPPRKEQQSEPPRSGVSGAISAVGSAAAKINTWPAAVAVVAFVAGVVAYLLLRP